MTYGGIRERQQGEGIDDVQRAVAGTAASSALDILTGVGGRVLSSAAVAAGREMLEGGLRQAITRTIQSGSSEAGTEMLQNVIEQVAGGSDPTTKQAMLETMEAGLAGALAGTTFTATGEAISAPFRPGADGFSMVERLRVTRDPEVQQAISDEQFRLFEEESNAIKAANPGISDADRLVAMDENIVQRERTARQNVLAMVREQRAAAAQQAEVGELSDTDPDVVQAFRSTLETLFAEVAEANPNASREEVLAHINNYAPLVLEEAKQQVAAARGGVGAGTTRAAAPGPRADDAGLAGPVGGGAVTGVPPVGATELPGAGVAPAGGIVGGRVGQPVAGLSVSDVGAGAQPSALVEPTAAQVKATVPAIEQAFKAAAIDFEDAYGVKKLNAEQKKQAARIVIQSPEVDPYDAIGSVLERGQRLRGEKVTPTPAPVAPASVAQPTVTEGPMPSMPSMPSMPAPTAQPTVEEGAVPPTGSEAAAAPTTAVEEELTARDQEVSAEMLAPEVQTEPTVAETATMEGIAPPATRTINDLAGAGTVNPENTNEVLIGGGGVQLTPVGEDILQLDSLRAVERGGGRKAMEQLTKAADANGTAIQLSPEPFAAPGGKEMSPAELTEWYKGFGFQEQPDGSMVRPAATPPSTITPPAALSPQQIVEQIDQFARGEAEDRGFDPDMFTEGARDAARGVEPLSDTSILEGQGAEALDAYKAGIQFGRDRVADMQAAPETGGTEPPTDANVDAAVSVKLTKAQIRRAEEAAGIRRKNLSAMQKRIVQSRTPTETMGLVGRLMLIAKNPDKDVNVLTSLYNMIQPGVLSMVLGFQQTVDVVRLGTRAGMANPARINDMIQDEYVPYVNRLLQRASRLSEKWGDFVADAPKGADAMAELMIFSNMVDADPSRAPDPVAYLAIDPKFQDLTARYAAETDPKKKSSLKGQLTERRGEITRLYFGGATQDPNGNPMVVKGWKDVPPKGKEIFREARDHYRKDFEEHYRLLVQRIDDGGFEAETAARLKKSVDDMFAEAMQRAIYFPLKRFGEHWVSIGKGASREFHMFEGFLEREAFLAQRKLSGDTRPVSVGFGRDSLRSLRGEVSDVSEALKSILDIIDKGGATDPELLKDSVFQMYLSSLPEADMRRNFIHRQFTTGFSTDALRTFAVTAVASANQLGRLAYSGKLQNLIDQSYAETEFNPSKPRLDAITREMENRVRLTLSGDPEGAAARFADGVAKGTFLFLLSSVKSAFMNLTQLHLTGFPVLTAEFGEAATTAMAARYTGQLLTGRRIAYAVRDENGDVKPHSPRFTAEDSPYIRGLRETDPDRYAELQKAWLHAEEREVTQSTFTSAQNIYESGMEPSGTLSFTQAVRAGNTSEAVKRATENTIDGMGALFHHAERIGREIMYMSAFELAYDRGLKEGKTPEQAGEEARALAVKLTNEGMFDFSNWNKSRYSKAPVGRVALQMRAYSFQMTSLLARSAYNLIMAPPTKEGKLAAARVFMGIGAMTTLYAGVRASQFAILGMLAYGIYEFVMGLVPDDVDEEEEIETGVLSTETIDREFRKYADEQGRELSMKDMDYYIRTSWIPETFAGGIQDVFGLSDENTAKLALAADIGLPSLFGVDISNSIALTSLWHPVDTRADTPEARFYEGLGRTLLGPSGAFPTAAFKVWDEINKGNVGRAIEAGMPAFLRGYVKSERLQEEGLRIGKNNDIILRDPSFYDTYTLMMQSMGFAEAVSSREMQLSIAATDIERAVEQEKTDLLDRRYRATLDNRENPTDETARALREVIRDIRIYNLNYPSNAITADTLRRSFQQKRREAVERSGGMGYNPRIPVRLPLVEERREEQLREMAREAE
jgi:hypothetical protein